MLRALVGAALGLVALVVFAAQASAHATLVESTPASGARLEEPPRAVVLRFSERVEVALGGVRVFARDGARVDRGQIDHPGGQGSVVELRLPQLRDGAYVVTWRVVSSDSHPVQGAFTFAVGDAAPVTAGDIAGLSGNRETNRVVGVTYGVSRALAFGGLLVLLGGVAFPFLVWSGARRDARFRAVVVTALVVLTLATVANLGLQGAYAAGLGLGDVLSSEVIGGVLRTRFGRVYELRLALLGAAAGLVWMLLRRPSVPAWWRWTALAVGVGLAITPGLAGHGAVGSHQPYALVADVIHVLGAAVWLGGTVMLWTLLARFGPDAASIATRFSQVAFYAVIALVATGAFQSFRQVGTVDALRSTDFGKLVVVKSLLVGTILVVAFLSRRTVQRWAGNSVGALRRTVGVELVIAVAVLSVTALLVNTVPSRTYAAAPQSGELTAKTLLLDYTVSPGRAGPNDVHLYSLTRAGQIRDVEEMSLTLGLPAKGVDGIEVTLTKAGPGHFQALDFDVPFPGRWTMVVTARTSDIDAEVFEGTVQIR